MDRREFMKQTGRVAVALGMAGTGSAAGKQIDWSFQPKGWKSLGPDDMIPQINRAMQWANTSLIKYGIVWTRGGCCMRAACMPAEAGGHYYAMTGDKTTLEALRAAVKTFRKYRNKARGRRIPYEEITGPVELEGVEQSGTEAAKQYTLEYEAISCHVGRNMRGMRAAAHALRDETLLRQVADELNWWIDNPLGFNREKHFFDARIFLDDTPAAAALVARPARSECPA